MAKTKIIFDNTDYSIEQSSLDAIDDSLEAHLSTTMSGSGAVINMGNTAYDVDSVKLANAATEFITHLGLIAGEGSKVIVNGIEYAIDSSKVEGATANLHVVLSSLSSGESGGDDVATVAAGLYETGSNYTVLVKDWDTLVSEGVVHVNDGAVSTNADPNTGANSSADILVGDLVLPDDGTITEIPDIAFASCTLLTGIKLPSSITNIGIGAFAACNILTSITIPEGVTSIGDRAFYGCSGLVSVVILEGVTSIGEQAFDWCSGLTNITLPDSLTSIGKLAFRYCGITSIAIPSNVTSIGNSAFAFCEKLGIMTFEGTTAEWNAIGVDPGSAFYHTLIREIICTDGTVAR